MNESRSAIYVGIVATLLIAATKFTAAFYSGSSAMVSEGVHSLVDTADGLLLLLGQHRAARPADEAHPLGHGKELYFWSLIVAILFFALGAGMAFYEGIQHMLRPEPITDPTWNYVVLGASAVFTLASFTVAFRQFRRRLDDRGYWATFRKSKDPTLFTLVLEDLADMVGLVLAFIGIYASHRLGTPYLDGAASVGVGVVLTVVAVLLARESKGLLIGEGASRADRALIYAAAGGDPAVVAVRRPLTMYFGPHNVLVAMDVDFRPDLTTAEIARAVDRIEARIRRGRPDIAHIYIETESIRNAAAAPSRAGLVEP
ncbi:MAG: cation diffusion facilitator family transporter [Gemmatimonadaceae bacterium]